MEWDELPTVQATAKQRRAIYKFISGDPDATKDLIRYLSPSEADVVLKALIAADKKQKASQPKSPREKQIIARCEVALDYYDSLQVEK